MRKHLKWLSCLLVAAMVLSFASACSSNTPVSTSAAASAAATSSDSAATAAQSATPQATTAAEPLSLTIARPNFKKDPAGTLVDNEWLKRMEDFMGRKLNITWNMIPWTDYTERQNLLLASGDLPDVMPLYNASSLLETYRTQGLFLELTQYANDLPNYNNMLKQTTDADKFVYSPDGKLYGFADVSVNSAGFGGCWRFAAYRFDVFQKNNIKIPETLDDYYSAAKTLKSLYPDSYPINVSTYHDVMNMFSQINHVDVSWTSTYICYDTASKTFVFAPLQDGFKDAVAFVHKLYSEKLLDPEFLTDGQDQETSKMMKDKTFMTTEMYSTDVLPLNNNENFKGQWGIAMYPQNPKYGPPQTEQPINPKAINGVVSGITSSTVVSAKTKEPEAVLKLIDHQYSDDMITLMNWGIEGKTFTKQSDGSFKLSDEIMSAKDPYSVMEGYGISSSGTCRSGIVWTPQDSGVGIALCPDLPVYQGGQYSKENPVKFSSDSYAKGIAVPGVQDPYTNFNADELAAVSQNMTPIATFIKENVTKFITGERALDQWDSFIKEISKQGDYAKIVQMYNDKLK